MSKDAPEPIRADAAAHAPSGPRLGSMADFLIARVWLALSPLGREIARFAHGLEECAFREARERGLDECRIALQPVGRVYALTALGERTQAYCGRMVRLPAFLAGLGVRTVFLDVSLESDQVSRALYALWRIRHLARGRSPTRLDRALGRTAMREALASSDGLRYACTEITWDADTGALRVRNSYRPHAFSRLIARYKARRRRLQDHRAFYRAAPRYAALVMAAMLLPAAVAGLTDWHAGWVAFVSIGLALLGGLAAYLVFVAIASEEYDKEQQARELRRRHASLTRLYDGLQRDLNTARGIQRSFLPDPRLRPFPDHVAFAHAYLPEMAVGGDYYDLRRLDDRRVALLLADVAGHGMSAAFVTGLIKTTFEFEEALREDVSRFVARVNNVLERLTPPQSFAAMIYGIYDVATHEWTYANAGHGPAPIAVRADGTVEALDAPVDLLAGVNPEMIYEEGRVALAPGDKLVLCTDGVPDCMDAEGARLGEPGLRAALARNAALSAKDLCDAILTAVREHSAGAEQTDDVTVLVMEVVQ